MFERKVGIRGELVVDERNEARIPSLGATSRTEEVTFVRGDQIKKDPGGDKEDGQRVDDRTITSHAEEAAASVKRDSNPLDLSSRATRAVRSSSINETILND